MSLPFVASAISRRDGSPADGVHLLWTAPSGVGYSLKGFDIQRRDRRRSEPRCYTLTDAERQTLHEALRVRVPPGLVAVRRAACPTFPDKAPDEPARDADVATETAACTDFRRQPEGRGRNPRPEKTGTYLARGPGGQPLPQSEVRGAGPHRGLVCGFRLEIELATGAQEVELTLVRFADPPRVEAFDQRGTAVAAATASAPSGQPETVRLSAKGEIRRVVVTARNDEVLLQELCLRRTRTAVNWQAMPTGRGPGVRRDGPLQVRVLDRAGQPLPNTRVVQRSRFTGLELGYRTELTLASAATAVEVTLVSFGRPPRAEARRADGSIASAAAFTSRAESPGTLRLGGGGIRRVTIDSAQGEALLLEVGLDQGDDERDGRRSRFLQPPVRLHASATTRAIAATPGCIAYDIRLNQPHYRVRVVAGLPAVLAVAMRDGKAVDARLGTAAGGTQDVSFNERVVDQVLLYAAQQAAGLTICTDVRDPKQEDAEWANVPFIAKGVHVPVRNVNPALPSAAAEEALAASRLVPGESFDAAAFREVAKLMNDTAQNAGVVSPMVQSVLTREDPKDPFVELRGWPYSLALLVEGDWRRMLGFGFLDKGPGLTPGNAYDYRVTGRFRRRELHEQLLGFHTVPLGTTLPIWFHLGPVLLQTPLPAVTELFPKPPAGALRAAGVKGIPLHPLLPGGPCLTLTFAEPVSRVVLELEPTFTQGMHFEARTSDYLFGLSGSTFSGPIPPARRVELVFAEPVDTVRLFGRGFLLGVRVPTQPPAGSPDDVLSVSVVIPGVVYEPTAPPPAPPFLGTLNLQQPMLPGDPALTTQSPPQQFGFRLLWLPPPPSGAPVPWPPDLAAFPPMDVLGFHLERRRVDTAGPFADVDESKPPTRFFGNRTARKDPPQLYPGVDLTAIYPEAVKPEPPLPFFMEAEDTLRSMAKPDGPPPGSLHQYRVFSVDAIGRRSAVPTLGTVVRLEKRIAPPQPVGPTTPPPAGVQRPVGVAARVLQSLDARLPPGDVAILGVSANAIVLEWAWTQAERARDPFATEFRVYFRPVPPDVVRGSLTGAAVPVGGDFELSAALNQTVSADAFQGRYVRAGGTAFKVKSHTAGQNVTVRFEKSALDATAVPAAGPFEVVLPPDAAELRPERWPERTAVVPITAAENYQFVFRNRLTLSATQPDVRVWVGVSSADGQSYIPDAVPAANPNGGRAGNESSVVAVTANARYLGRPVFIVPPPLPAVPERVTDEPADDLAAVRLDLPGLLPAVAVPAGFTVKLERLSVDALLNRISARPDNTIGARLPDGSTPNYTLANPGDQAAFLAQIRTGEGVRVEGRFLMDFLTRHLVALEPLWQSALPEPVPFAPVTDALPGKAERYVHRVRLVDAARHVSAGGAILPQFVRVPSLASPEAPAFDVPGSNTDVLTLTARVRDTFDLKWLVVFTHAAADTDAADPSTAKPQLLRLPNRRDLYPNGGVRLRLSDGTLLSPSAAVAVATGTAEVPDRVLTVPVAAGFEKRVSAWVVAMTRDGITSRVSGPRTAFTGAAPLTVPALTVTAAAGTDLASWGAAPAAAEAALERSTDGGAAWVRVTPWIREASFPVPAVAGARQYRLVLRASRGRRATGPAVAPS